MEIDEDKTCVEFLENSYGAICLDFQQNLNGRPKILLKEPILPFLVDQKLGHKHRGVNNCQNYTK